MEHQQALLGAIESFLSPQLAVPACLAGLQVSGVVHLRILCRLRFVGEEAKMLVKSNQLATVLVVVGKFLSLNTYDSDT